MTMKQTLKETLSLFILLLAWLPSPAAPPPPNIVIVLVDDMGFSDLGCYGSEIPTPNLDRLAAGGLRFTQFYNGARCCPTRAALLTGMYAHQAGMGWMTTDHGADFPGYQGRLLDQTVTIAEALKPAGYFTAMTGKWHVGQPLGCVPWERGFDRTLNAPAGGFYYSRSAGTDAPQLFLNGRQLALDAPELPPNWYSTDLWTEFGLRFVDEARAAKKPFFLYLAHNAPHFPLQADPEDIAQFRGKYRTGWDALSAARHRRQLDLGIVDKTWKPASRPEAVAAWDKLSEADKDHFDHLMAVYAACMSRLDRSIGTLVEGLKQRGELDNTLILFLSDNGGNAEGGLRGQAQGPGALGSANSVVFTGGSWAWLQNTPFRKSKRYSDEGGIATPLIAHWPAGIRARGGLNHAPSHIIDLMATCLELSGAKLPTQIRGRDVAPLEGISLAPAFRGQPLNRTQPLFWEHEGHAAIREGDWKLLLPAYGQNWELYNLKEDRTEQHNLAAAQPERVRELQAKWDAWAERTHVKPWPEGLDKTAAERAALTNRPARTASPQTNSPPTTPRALKDGPGRWPAAKAIAWQREKPWLVGCNFIPSTAINQLEMWQADTFDPVTTDRELGFAAGLGFTSIRVFLHDLLWKQDAEGFLQRVEQFLGLAQKHGLGVMFVLFDSCWHPLPRLGPQPAPLPHTHNSGWVQSPGVEVLQNPAAQSHLRDYVVGVIRRFANDPRVQVWDLWNEPDQFDGGSPKRRGLEPKNKPDLVNALLPPVFAWAREARPTQPLTAGVERELEKLGDFSNLSTVKRILLENSDIITFHHYGSFAQFTNIIASLQSFGRPVLCTEYMARPMGSRFEPHLGYMKEKNVGAYSWGFVSGKTQTIYPWDSWRKDYANEPPVWFHDILRPDGTPCRPEEADYIRHVTGRR